MGTLAELFESGQHKAKKGLFNNLVLITRLDGKVGEAEMQLLARIARSLSLTPEQVRQVIEHPDEYPMIPPSDHTERCERLILFIQMAYVDGNIAPEEEAMIEKCGIGLGFTEEELDRIRPTIISSVKAGKDFEDILKLIC